MSEKKQLIILTGPTAVGKTQLSLKLADRIGGEIISADSMQVYETMDIGTAKIKPSMMQGIKHHLIDICKPWEDFNVVKFSSLAKAAIDEIVKKNKIPIIVGGTGFYIQAVLYDIHFTENQEDNKYRRELEAIAREQGSERLHEMLRQIDSISADLIHRNNSKRVIRALEYYQQTGEPISKHNQEERNRNSPYEFHYFVLTEKREDLYRKIDQRVDEMMEQGLVEEVRRLIQQGCDHTMVSMQGLGYKEIVLYLSGQISLEQAVYQIKRDTRHFAKRQLTWFKREPDVEWFHKEEYAYEEECILEEMIRRIEHEPRPTL